MSNEIVRASASAPAREIGVITEEIKQLCRQAQATAVMYIVEIGRRLVEAKDALPFGEWGDWLRSEVGFSQSTANNYMRLFEEYGASQITIFGATVDSQSFANLPYSKALALLAVDKEEREEFAKEVDVENISLSELKEAIRERDAAREREAALSEKYDEAVQRRIEAEAAADGYRDLEKKVKELEASLTDAKEKEGDLKDKLKKAKDNPKIPAAKLEEIKKSAEDEAKKSLSDEISKELEATKEQLKAAEEAKAAAERAKREAETSLENAKKQLKTASPEVNRFKTLFEGLQEQAAKCKKQIEKVRESDAETAEKLTLALCAFAEGLV